jgi:hypothetical protein
MKRSKRGLMCKKGYFLRKGMILRGKGWEKEK